MNGPDRGAWLDRAVAQTAAALRGEHPVLPPSWQARDLDLPEDAAAVIETSGSTGQPRGVVLSAPALLASARASQQVIGAGQWLLALPAHYVAGLQVLVRSLMAGTRPVGYPLGHSFDAAGFVASCASLAPDQPHYTSLVPTQVGRLIGDRAALDVLAGFEAVLIGGAHCPADLLTRLRDAGVHAVTTYGMSETAGGCVYDGRPLPGVRVRCDDAGVIEITGPQLASGYLGEPELTARAFRTDDGARWFHTSDLGAIDESGHLSVFGRADDIVITGGVKVAPLAVEQVLRELPGIGDCVVVGLPDPQWGQVLVAVVVGEEVDLAEVRVHLTTRLGAPAAPKALVHVDQLPLLAIGKVDRRAVVELARGALGSSR